MSGFVLAMLVAAGDWRKTVPLVGGVALLWAVGTIDDRRTVSRRDACCHRGRPRSDDLGLGIGLGPAPGRRRRRPDTHLPLGASRS